MAKILSSIFIKRILTTDKNFHNKIKEISGFYPKNEELYKLAFIHKSATLQLPNGATMNNERLEFLGDAVLDAVVAEYLYINFPDKKEGFLTQTRSKIVNGEYLGKLAISLGLDKLILSYASHFDKNKHILGDAFEAFTGAVFLDRGYEAVKKFIVKQLFHKHIDLKKLLKTETNYKSKLIEWSQKEKKEVNFQTCELKEEEVERQRFLSEVVIEGKIKSKGEGNSKKEAEQNAAQLALKELK